MHRKLEKNEWFIISAICIFTLCLSLVGICNGHDWGDDFSQYIAQAKAIVNNDTAGWFKDNQFIIENSSKPLGPMSYPWLFPILLAPLYKIFGLNYIAFKVFLSCAFAASVCILYVLLRRRNIGRLFVISFIILIMVNSKYLRLTQMVLSDIPCFLFTTLSWALIDEHLSKKTLRNAIFAGIVCFTAFFTRTMGIATLISMLMIDAINSAKTIVNRHNRNQVVLVKELLFFTIPYVTFFSLWFITGMIFPKDNSGYAEYFSINLTTIAQNIKYYLNIFWDFIYQGSMDNPDVKTITMVIYLPIIAVAIIGLFDSLLKKDHLAFYFAIFIGTLCVYKPTQGTRFIITLYPIFLLFIYYGSKLIILKKRQIILATIVGIIAFSNCFVCSAKQLYNKMVKEYENPVYNSQAIEAYEYISNEVDANEVIFFSKPRALYLHSGRRS